MRVPPLSDVAAIIPKDLIDAPYSINDGANCISIGLLAVPHALLALLGGETLTYVWFMQPQTIVSPP